MFYYLANLVINKKGFKTSRKDFVITRKYFFITKEKRYIKRIIVCNQCNDLLFIKQTHNHKKIKIVPEKR